MLDVFVNKSEFYFVSWGDNFFDLDREWVFDKKRSNILLEETQTSNWIRTVSFESKKFHPQSNGRYCHYRFYSFHNSVWGRSCFLHAQASQRTRSSFQHFQRLFSKAFLGPSPVNSPTWRIHRGGLFLSSFLIPLFFFVCFSFFFFLCTRNFLWPPEFFLVERRSYFLSRPLFFRFFSQIFSSPKFFFFFINIY